MIRAFLRRVFRRRVARCVIVYGEGALAMLQRSATLGGRTTIAVRLPDEEVPEGQSPPAFIVYDYTTGEEVIRAEILDEPPPKRRKKV